MNTNYICEHCDTTGGTFLGLDIDHNPVCTECGDIDKYGNPVHKPAWSWNPTTAYNRTLNDEKQDNEEE